MGKFKIGWMGGSQSWVKDYIHDCLNLMTYGRIKFYIELKKLKPVFDQIIDIVFIYVVNSIKSLKSKTSF